ncbi:MAG: GNAT family N-acetyltransferase, partial [Pseudomonadota bacterium]
TGLSWRCDVLTEKSVRKLASEWQDLAENAVEKNIFQLPNFIFHSLPLLSSQDPHIVTIRQDGLVIGLAILRRDLGYAKLPVPFWKSASHPEQYLGSPLVRAGYEQEFTAGLTAWLDRSPAQICFLQLNKLAGDGAVANALLNQCRSDHRAVLIAERHQRAAIRPNTRVGSADHSHLSVSRRKSIRRARKRLEAMGELSIERLSEGDQLSDWTDQFLAMENTGWKKEASSSILSCRHETALYQATIPEAFESGNLNLTRLCLDGKPIAFTLDILSSSIGYCLKSAIHPDFRKFSPGVLMEFETLKYYSQRPDLRLIDSCTHPDNAMLNELWPDKRTTLDLAIGRRGIAYEAVFKVIQSAKVLLRRFAND